MNYLNSNINVFPDQWEILRKYTDARIGLGRAGSSLPTNRLLDFKLAHAQARDAVYSLLDLEKLKAEIAILNLQSLEVFSDASNRTAYLSNPDKGRKLSKDSANLLINQKVNSSDLCIVLADGLSADAINIHAITFLKEFFQINQQIKTPIVFANQSRVALGDEIGCLLKSKIVVMLIGERPGLTSPTSLGAYITFSPKPGITDEKRNCISNIRPEGLSYKEAALKLNYLIIQMKKLGFSGVELKDDYGGMIE
ncbi:MAG: ethanolamine ammonia-lyase subunit EutC [Bacteroidota bacterium]|nr:ethanolamine ammonia-lyase subunit EutC [Bacteroidota bacterium]